MTDQQRSVIFSAADVATYVVCPLAWHLRFRGLGEKQQTARAQESFDRRREWIATQDLSGRMIRYARVLFLLLLLLVAVVFLWDHRTIVRRYQPKPVTSSFVPILEEKPSSVSEQLPE